MQHSRKTQQVSTTASLTRETFI